MIRCIRDAVLLAALAMPLAATAASPIASMSVEEKVAQLQATAPAIPRLGVRAYNWWNEGLHGVARNGHATVFPQAIGLAATWDEDLLRSVGDVVATEARSKYNAVGIAADHGRYQGLTIWSPNINIFRDPRWGRGQETYGEDPVLTGTLATAFVTGLQGPDAVHPKTIAAVKHLAVHSGPEAGRHGFDVDVSPHDLEATYLPAFRRVVVEGKVGSVMCAYNSLHGIPVCANPTLLEGHLRKAWGFDGFVVTDCDSVYDMAKFHFFRPTMAQNAAAALEAGTDLNCGNSYASLAQAVREKAIPERLVDQALGRLWAARRRLGLDGVGSPYDNLGPEQVHTAQAAALALRAARESIVLLKNDGVLPLRPDARIAVIGPNADSLSVLEANYHGTAVSPVTPLEGLRRIAGTKRIVYAQGSAVADGVPTIIPETALRTSAGEPGLTAEYFGNADFSGAPAVKRVDRTIDLDLYNAVPVPGFERGAYGIRWSGKLTPPAPGNYRIAVGLEHCWDCGDRHDTVRLAIDDRLVELDPELGATITFADTHAHDIRLEFRHSGGDWGVRLQWQAPASAQLDEALAAAKDADAIVVFAGLSPEVEGEELPISVPGFDHGDRTDLGLPAPQENLLRALANTHKPLIVVVLAGSAVALNFADAHANAVLQAWYPGEAGGTAIAETLSGENNPSGRLPVTVYKSVRDLPAFIDYRMENRTYRYFTGEPLYAFGHGLSYTTFRYGALELSTRQVKAGESVRVAASVTNTGTRVGDEVVQLYLSTPANEQGLRRELKSFRRVRLRPGESTKVTFDLSPRDLSLVDAQGERWQRAVNFTVHVGGAQPRDGAGASAKLSIVGETRLPE